MKIIMISLNINSPRDHTYTKLYKPHICFLPLVIAILIFLTYHFISLFAKNSSEDSSMDPILASWLSSLILLPFSIYLTNRATKDRALIDFDSIFIPLKRLVTTPSDFELSTGPKKKENLSELKTFETKHLIEILKNYRELEHSLNYKNTALKTLKDRGISELELKMAGHLTNQFYESALRFYMDFKENSKLAVVFNLLTLVTAISGVILANNLYWFGNILIGIAVISLLFYSLVLQKSLKNQSEFYTLLSFNFVKKSFVLILLGLPFFYLYRVYFIRKMEEELLKIS